ncbi:MAG TPA: 2-oxoacid:acceptor oxidoreductase family protein [Spirochaetota bacterium]|nr:2-oxoacid:acceptor oxidoreductase family protein [Spirochaetota bacterium]HOM11035.1 2-oxoacid:acceptor oxidoreductase family protein [Spirochaetota bacterium]HPP50843.1 2-oxoacid:acceptor oxidoreductase family protein [Spirochaetota bacterium]HXK66098.1 2-oxoacid:acceptor oxidoreductase family protein [Spirochaetota bacterium]
MYYDMIMAGFGGQGIQIISQLVAVAAINKGYEVTYLPSYGVEKRGGRTNVFVVISDEEIGSPITNHPYALLVMDQIAYDTYIHILRPDGLLVANESLIDTTTHRRNDIVSCCLFCNEEAVKLGNAKLANMIALGALLKNSNVLTVDDIEKVIDQVIPERLAHTIPANMQAIRHGYKLA